MLMETQRRTCKKKIKWEWTFCSAVAGTLGTDHTNQSKIRTLFEKYEVFDIE